MISLKWKCTKGGIGHWSLKETFRVEKLPLPRNVSLGSGKGPELPGATDEYIQRMQSFRRMKETGRGSWEEKCVVLGRASQPLSLFPGCWS